MSSKRRHSAAFKRLDRLVLLACAFANAALAAPARLCGLSNAYKPTLSDSCATANNGEGGFALDLYRAKDSLSLDQGGLIAIGFVVAFLSGWVVVKSMLAFVTRYGFMPFAIWRILVGGAGLIALQMAR